MWSYELPTSYLSTSIQGSLYLPMDLGAVGESSLSSHANQPAIIGVLYKPIKKKHLPTNGLLDAIIGLWMDARLSAHKCPYHRPAGFKRVDGAVGTVERQN